jgi:HEAT repeat protein/thiamine kinase-like enzyme
MFPHIEQPLFNKDYFGRISGYRVVLPEYVDVYTQKLTAWLHHHRPEQRWLAAHQLAVLGHPQAVEYLLAALDDPHWLVRLHAAKDLGRLADHRAIEPLIKHTTDENPSVRRRVIQALKIFIQDERALAAVVACLNDLDKQVRYLAVDAISQIKSPHLIPLLAQAGADVNRPTAWLATYALTFYGSQAIDPLLALLENPNNRIRRDAIYALGRIGGERAEKAVQPFLTDLDERLRWSSMVALRWIRIEVTQSIITSPQQITPTWLTAVLNRGGWSAYVTVNHLEVEANQSVNAQMVRLRPTYSADSPPDAPAALLLKICANSDNIFGPSEVDYYTRDYLGLPNAPIPRCYHARYSAEPRRYHLLVEDLSATHQPAWQQTPTLPYAQALAEAMATLHNHWWGAERLQAGNHPLPDEATIGRYLANIQPGLESLLAEMGTTLEPFQVQALRDIFVHHPALMIGRARNPNGQTLIHGDPNPGNILAPKNGNSWVYLIDRQPFDWSLTIWLGVSDLAYAIVHWWQPEQRRQLEFPMLHHYHQQLQQQGITSYSWEQLVQDYKLAAVQSIYVAVAWCVDERERTTMRWVWQPQLEKALTAFFDLDCATLWQQQP